VKQLALFDLDNTLLDREAAFAMWTEHFIAMCGLSPEAQPLIKSMDRNGLTPREEFFAQVRARFGIATSAKDLIEAYRVEYPACFSVNDETVRAIRSLRANNWKVGVVTNGPPTQRAKLEATQLVNEFDAICVSALVGFRKPEIEIFEEAARICEVPLSGWMVGDSPSADVAGGKRAGLRTIWIPRGRTWDEREDRPDAVAATVSEAASLILAEADHVD
jgi:HAD superfamily hydrolase (TIGR01549 family)